MRLERPSRNNGPLIHHSKVLHMSFPISTRIVLAAMLLSACGHRAPDATLEAPTWVEEADIGQNKRIYLTVADKRRYALAGRDLQPLLFDKLSEGFARQNFQIIRRVSGDFCELHVQLQELNQASSREKKAETVTAAVTIRGQYGRNILNKTYREETEIPRKDARAMTEPDLLGKGLERTLTALFADEELRAFLTEHCTPEKPSRASM